MGKKYKHYSNFPSNQGYTFPFVCFECRKSFKRPHSNNSRPCPDCGGKAILLARKFKPPRKDAIKEWEVVKFLVSKGFFYFTVHDANGTVPYPKKMSEAKVFAEKYKSQSVKFEAEEL